MGVEKPDPGMQPVQVKVEPDHSQTLQHFDFVDSDEEYTATRKIRNRYIGSNRPACTTALASTTDASAVITPTTMNNSSLTNYTSSQPKKMKCKHNLIKAESTSSATDKRLVCDLPASGKLTVKGLSYNKTDTFKDVCQDDGQLPTPQLDTTATLSPLKESHVSFCGLGSGDVSESSLRPSLLDEVLSEKKLLLTRSPSVVKFFKRHQSLLAKRSSNILQLGSHNLMDKPLGKS